VVSGSSSTSSKKKNLMKSDCYVLELSVRSKLIRPVKELPFCKVGDIVNESDPVEVTNGGATVRVKFTARPRTVFHKHADMMILVANLMAGGELITSSALELIFRGGTGSNHSADSKKKALLNKGDKKGTKEEMNMMTQEVNQLQMMSGMNQVQMMNNMVPMMHQSAYGNEVMMNYMQQCSQKVDQNMTEYENFDVNDFWNDFYINKGEKLIPFENNEEAMQFAEWKQENAEPQIMNNMAEPQMMNNMESKPMLFNPDQFSMTVNGVRNMENGRYEATVQGNLMNKNFQGTIHFNMDMNSFSGQFSGNFAN